MDKAIIISYKAVKQFVVIEAFGEWIKIVSGIE
jgi:hypothetical protein